MIIRMQTRPHLITVLVTLLCGCNVSSRLLIPRTEWLVEPTELGFECESVELETGANTSVHGWFLPNSNSDGRTVVLCHGDAANISFYHPYYTFLHAAGFHVFVFDYRGYGKSRGKVSIRAIFSDTERVLEHILARPDVDRDKVVLFGTSLGAIVALRSAAFHPELAGVVIEDAASPEAYLRRSLGGFLTFWVQLLALPSRIEPANNAAGLEMPALFICGAWDPALRQHLAAAGASPSPVANWVQPRTAHAPSGLLEHDLEYQAGVSRFLDACVEGRCPRVEVAASTRSMGALTITPHDLDASEPLAVELCCVDETGQAEFRSLWLTGEGLEVSIDRPFEFATAWAYQRVQPDLETGAWSRTRGPLALASSSVQFLQSLASAVRTSITELEEARVFASALAELEARDGPLPVQAQTELIPDLLFVGATLLKSELDADRSEGIALLRRCVNAEPPIHGAHYWPGSPYRVGFRYLAEVQQARSLLVASD